MSIHRDRITVMMKKDHNWIVTNFKKDSDFFKMIVSKNQNRINFNSAKDMMKHERVQKSRSQGIRVVSDNMKYKQVTVYAYWENLNNPKSGNASVVCSNIMI